MKFLLTLLCLPLLALDNSVTIYDASALAQTARPTTLYRTFAQGEFATGTYPKPRIGGTVPTAWQVDVKTVWPDGSVMAAYISFRLDLTANGSAVVDFVRDANPCHLGNLATCQAAALTQAQMLDYDTGTGIGTWGATWYGTVNSIEYSASARTMITAGAWRYWLRGPVVTDVIVEDRSTALSHDFGWQHTGGVWAAPTSNTYKSLHPVYEVRFYPDPDGVGALANWAGVEVDAQLWNVSLSRLQRINTLALELRTGNPDSTSAYSVTNKSFHARSRRHKLVWSGTAPGAVVIDHNFPYLIHTKILPPYDYSLGVASTLANGTLSAYNSNLGSDEAQWCDTHPSKCANWEKWVATTGGRGDIAPIGRWFLDYLYLMGHGGVTVATKLNIWNKLVIGNADAGNHAPIYLMEAYRTTAYNPFTGGSTSGFGHPISINIHLTSTTSPDEETWPPSPTNHICSASPCDGRIGATSTPYRGSWYADGVTAYTSHAPSFNPMAALLTGYHYYITGSQFEAAFALSTVTSGVGGPGDLGARWYKRGIIYNPQLYRGTAWGLKSIAWAEILTPDGEIEKAYFLEKLQANAAFHEGIMMLQTGAHTPTDPTCPGFVKTDSVAFTDAADMWCAGRDTWRDSAAGVAVPTTNPLFVGQKPSNPIDNADQIVNGSLRHPGYWTSYVATQVGWIASSGAILDVDGQPLFKHFRNGLAAHLAGRVLSSSRLMYLMRAIDWPWGGPETQYCTTYAGCESGALTSWVLGADMTNSQTSIVVNGIDGLVENQFQETAWVKIDNEYIQLRGDMSKNNPSSGKSTFQVLRRGVWGSAAATHTTGATVTWLPGFYDVYSYEYTGGYSLVPRAALAAVADANQISDYSPIQAYNKYAGALGFQTYHYNPQWALVPRERVQSVVATGGTGTVSMSWLAPSGAACKVFLGASTPATSSDAADTAANTSKLRRQTYSATGLSAGTKYYRISCGTARASGTVEVN